jgi:hypothetical protein
MIVSKGWVPLCATIAADVVSRQATTRRVSAAVNAAAAQARTERTTNSRTALRSYSLSATVSAGPKRHHRCISYTAPWRQVTQYGSRRSPDRIRIPQPRRSSAVPAASHPYASPSQESWPANSHCAVFHINVRSESIVVHAVGGHCAATMTAVRARRIE